MAEQATRPATAPPAGIARFFSASGRVGPIRFALAFAAALLIWWSTIPLFRHGGTVAYVLNGALWGGVLAKLVAEAARRLHDTNIRGAAVLAIIGALVGLVLLEIATGLSWSTPTLFLIVTGVIALGSAALLLRPGVKRANAHGPPPATLLAHAPNPGGRGTRRALAWATTAVLGSMLFWFGIISISNGMREQREADQRLREGGVVTRFRGGFALPPLR